MWELVDVVLELIAPIVDDSLASLPDSWPVARSQFTTLNLSDSATSPVDSAVYLDLSQTAALSSPVCDGSMPSDSPVHCTDQID